VYTAPEGHEPSHRGSTIGDDPNCGGSGSSLIRGRASAPDGAARAIDLPASGFLIADSTRCADCRVCEMVCSLVHEGRVIPSLARLTVERDAFIDDHANVRVCRQCLGPECLLACPRGAISAHAATGARVVDADLCDGCGACVKACHFGMIHVAPHPRLAFKCDLCDGEPHCVAHCPQQVLSYRRRRPR